MAPHSSTVAQKIPWTEEPGRLQSMGSLRVRHDGATSLSLSTFMHWRRKWQPTPVFLPGESHGRRSLVGCSPWGHTQSDTTEATWQAAGSHNYIYIHHMYIYTYIYVYILSHFSCVQLFVTLWTVCSPPGSSVYGILQARILE